MFEKLTMYKNNLDNCYSNITFYHGKGAESEFNEFGPHLKSTKNRFQLSAGLNL